MRRHLVLLAVVALVWAGQANAQQQFRGYHVQAVGVGDDLDKVFKAFGPPQAIQVAGKNGDDGAVQLLFFRGEDSLTIGMSNLPENRVVQLEMSGKSWMTDSPARIGDKVDGVVAKLGKPDKIDDLSMQKKWMLEQSGSDVLMRKLIERNSGDTGSWYRQKGLYLEYDKATGVVKSIKLYDPLANLSINVNKI